MMMRISLAAALGFVLFGATAPAQADLAVNGFELPEVTNSDGVTVFAGGSSIVDTSTTWLVGLHGVDQVEDPNDYIIGAAHSGDQYLDLSNSPGPGSIETTFPTVALQLYELTFWYADNYNFAPGDATSPDPSALVTVTGSLPLLTTTVTHGSSGAGALDWTKFVGQFVGDGASATLKFETFPTTDNRFAGILLDTISVAAVPEAAGWLFSGVACGVVSVGYSCRALGRRVKPAKA